MQHVTEVEARTQLGHASLSQVLSASSVQQAELSIMFPSGCRTCTLAEISARSKAWAAGLADRGLERGDRVCLFATTSFEFVTGCLAIWNVGGDSVTIPLPAGHRSHFSVEQETRRRMSLVESKALLLSPDDPVLDAAATAISTLDLEANGPVSGRPGRPDDLALIQFSSGSTAEARAVGLTHRTLVHYFELLRRSQGPFGDASEQRFFSWLPMFHDLGLVNYLLRPLAHGSPVWLLPTEGFVRDPLAWPRTMSRYALTTCAAPDFAYSLLARRLEKERSAQFDLSHWSWAGLGGEPVREETLSAFGAAAARFGFDPAALSPGYGLAEATCAVTAVKPGRYPVVDRVDRDWLSKGYARSSRSSATTASFVSAGEPLDQVEVSIRDEAGRTLPERAVGEIWVSGPSLMEGYVGDPQATQRVLRAGWLRTGDRGYLASGEVFITGREKDMIILNGVNFYAEDIESVVSDVEGVRRGGCVAIGVQRPGGGEGIVLLAESPTNHPNALARVIKRRVWSEAGVGVQDVAILDPGALPKTSSGKLRRSVAKRMYEEGRFGSPA